jgi:hypothetical protein
MPLLVDDPDVDLVSFGNNSLISLLEEVLEYLKLHSDISIQEIQADVHWCKTYWYAILIKS